jgi:adenosylhomocysteine nucleosidase
MKIGIMGAMPEEIGRIGKELLNVNETIVGNRPYWTGNFAGKDCVTVFSRWGKVAAASTVTTLIDHFGVDLVLFTGVAGAAREDLEIGDIVIADALIQHDMDASSSGLVARFEIPLLGVHTIRTPKYLVEAALAASKAFIENDLLANRELLAKADVHRLPNVYCGTIASGDQFISSSNTLGSLREVIPDLLAVEMEGAAVGQVCHEFGVPLLVLRSISDKADHSAALDFPKFVEHVVSFYSWGILKHLLGEL